ncbi:hypothetical protein AB1K84_22245 [Mesobacillus foraminis]|jgi:hypothetical protein|uniref:Uncharacterized protein n=1 Tax=Mesobacillus foraminis TaxID=279826 RepID=A0A4R2BM42_9BACI|nr:hypothetical protein [Mesobacillus foraminis]MBT2756244.1 hypothetical protein [Mesobacillus foraminis]TCN27743.1 hypothetical protein EV146_10170 [Mesobacillus foraminis]
MFDVQKGSMEEVLVILQNIGLQINDYQKTNTMISVDLYKELLEFSISIARKTNEVSETIDEIIEDIEQQF